MQPVHFESNHRYSIDKDRNLQVTLPGINNWNFFIPRRDFKRLSDLLSVELKEDKKLELTKKLEELDKQRQQIVDELRDVS